jgi:hypothetical protein
MTATAVAEVAAAVVTTMTGRRRRQRRRRLFVVVEGVAWMGRGCDGGALEPLQVV